MIDRRSFFHQPVKCNLRTYDHIGKTATSQGDDFTTDCLLDYNYFNPHMHEIFLQLYCVKWVPRDSQKDMLN